MRGTYGLILEVIAPVTFLSISLPGLLFSDGPKCDHELSAGIFFVSLAWLVVSIFLRWERSRSENKDKTSDSGGGGGWGG